MGRLTTIPGTRGVILPSAPVISMSAFDRQLAGLPGLRHVIDPAKLKLDGTDRDRMSGALITPRGANNSIIASDSAFNNQPVLSIAAGTSGLRLPPGIVTPSYTFITAALLDVNRYDAQTTSEIFGVLNGATTPAYLTFNTANGISFNQGDGNKNVTGAANAPARGQLHIRAVSFDAETLTSVQTLKDGSLFAFTHTSAYAPAVLDQWSVGSAADGAAIGFVGKMGISLIFDRAMHGPTLLPFMSAAMNLLKTKYGVS